MITSKVYEVGSSRYMLSGKTEIFLIKVEILLDRLTYLTPPPLPGIRPTVNTRHRCTVTPGVPEKSDPSSSYRFWVSAHSFVGQTTCEAACERKEERYRSDWRYTCSLALQYDALQVKCGMLLQIAIFAIRVFAGATQPNERVYTEQMDVLRPVLVSNKCFWCICMHIGESRRHMWNWVHRLNSRPSGRLDAPQRTSNHTLYLNWRFPVFF